MPEAHYGQLRALDLRNMSDNSANAWLGKHSSLYGNGEPHSLQHIIRETGRFGPEFFFDKSAFTLMEVVK
jgi:hypothetical protein